MTRARIDRIDVLAFDIPTDAPEADGTLEWNETTLLVVRAHGGGERSLGYSYSHVAAARLISETLADVVRGRAAMETAGAFEAMVRAVRNYGAAGLALQAISAVDAALWDLKARILGVSVAALLGPLRAAAPVYESGGFTSYSMNRLQAQLRDWTKAGARRVKMKVGARPGEDADRVRAAREAIGPVTELFVDANGAYDQRQALVMAEAFAESGVSWLEEPVPSDDLGGLRFIRERIPGSIAVAAGEYGHDCRYFRRMLEAGAVDILQPDATRCGGPTGFMKAAALCEAFGAPLSAHAAPSLHAHLCCAAPAAIHLENFHDHARIEAVLFEGAPEVDGDQISPNFARPGFGLELNEREAARFAL